MNFAYSKALAGESIDMREKFDHQNNTFNGVTFEDLEKFARIVAYKVAKNLKNGKKMDDSINPLK